MTASRRTLGQAALKLDLGIRQSRTLDPLIQASAQGIRVVLGDLEERAVSLHEHELVAASCLKHEGTREARVRIEKPGALRFARTVGVDITRGSAEP